MVQVNFLPKKTFEFVVWNTKENRDDVFKIEKSMLPNMTDEMAETAARVTLSGILSDKTNYSGQKIRKLGEPRE